MTAKILGNGKERKIGFPRAQEFPRFSRTRSVTETSLAENHTTIVARGLLSPIGGNARPGVSFLECTSGYSTGIARRLTTISFCLLQKWPFKPVMLPYCASEIRIRVPRSALFEPKQKNTGILSPHRRI
jgi:hypothetical protein